MLVYKIFRDAEWNALQDQGHSQGAPIDIADGFVHLSTADQVEETAAKHFAGVEPLWIAMLDAEDLGADLKWEVSRGDALFPHLYRDLKLDDVKWCKPLPLRQGKHEFPDLSE